MKRTFAGLAGLMCIGFLAGTVQAAPLGAAADTRPTAASSNVVQAHYGIHWSCRRDSAGWHRSHIWGRERCVPRARAWYRFW